MLIVLLALGFTGCDNNGNGGSGGGGSFIGAQLSIIDMPVYNITHSETGDVTWGARFTGSGTVQEAGFMDWDAGSFVSVGGTGEITDGLLTFTIGIPTQTRTVQQAFGDMEEVFNNTSISVPNARVAEINELRTWGSDFGGQLWRMWGDQEESVTYVYVDRNVTITGQGRTLTMQGFTITTRNLNLDLRTGWNAITQIQTVNWATMTVTMSIVPGVVGRTRWAIETW